MLSAIKNQLHYAIYFFLLYGTIRKDYSKERGNLCIQRESMRH